VTRVQLFLVRLILLALHGLRSIVSLRRDGYRLLLLPGLEGTRWQVGRWRAWRTYAHARRHVPAYAAFLAEHGDPRVRARWLRPDLSSIPATDKDNYIRRYSIEERCVGGRLPRRGVVIDESSGSSGTANDWVRGADERREVKQALQLAFSGQFGDSQVIFLNAFALGPWATGMNVSMSLVDITVLKSIGPDIAKIEATLDRFGSGYRYVVAGYPPFLKALADEASVDWSAFDVTFVFGGEGMSESMRDYLRAKGIRGCYGSYGASDLEINIAAENDFTIAVRRLLAERDDLAATLARPEHGVSPMVFQFNPIDYCIEESTTGELVVTVGRVGNVQPKIRYDIHDLGHVLRLPELRRVLKEHGVDLASLPRPAGDLPLLFVYGRADSSVAYYGSKVVPAEVERAVFGVPELAAAVSGFALLVREDADANKRLSIALELRPGASAPSGGDDLREGILAALAATNQDFREALRFMPVEARPALAFHGADEGPFADEDIRLKRRYIRADADLHGE
jgi:phenylacetate-CoA ligase